MVIEIQTIWHLYALFGYSFIPILFPIMILLALFMGWMDDLQQRYKK